ncbi:uncharacterized protein LOC112558064 [Pomacea canaliculata]|uniref:uncharacterized protein LOC112558064 n=1 Tax=Pomacea canaliculata TaxID=400727 RepID=UPI000D72BE23|nr:uncharacterized protein LOC112558064 [Pomacea canaliculata]
MIIVVTCTAIVVLIIKRSARWRKVTSKVKASAINKESRTTSMLMAVAAVYIACYLPSCVTLVINSIVPDFGSLGGRYTRLFYLVSALQLLLFACNSSVNFIIYMLMSRKFFKTYCRFVG